MGSGRLIEDEVKVLLLQVDHKAGAKSPRTARGARFREHPGAGAPAPTTSSIFAGSTPAGERGKWLPPWRGGSGLQRPGCRASRPGQRHSGQRGRWSCPWHGGRAGSARTFWIAADHDGEGACRRADVSAAHGASSMAMPRRQGGGDSAGGFRADGGAVDEGRAGGSSFRDAGRARAMLRRQGSSSRTRR